ncbi:hypothetical protein KAR91_08860 [Candidatus Pacearchaeota archaeon]|nr:hypothetical protein [Candidatus Pacearchaeota archaeon]
MSTNEDKFLGVEEDYNSADYSEFLDSIFAFGTMPSRVVDIVVGLSVTLRVITPAENLEIAKVVDLANGLMEKEQLLRMETLCRAIVQVNGQLLRFSDSMIEEWKEFRGLSDKDSNPSDVEQQRFMIKFRFNQPLINITYTKYTELVVEQEKTFLELKKK